MEAKFADVPDALWRQIEPLIRAEPPKPKGGRPLVSARVVMAGILYDGRRGIAWKWSSLDSASVKAPKGGPHGPKSD